MQLLFVHTEIMPNLMKHSHLDFVGKLLHTAAITLQRLAVDKNRVR